LFPELLHATVVAILAIIGHYQAHPRLIQLAFDKKIVKKNVDIFKQEESLQPKPSGVREDSDLKLYSMWR
jgi:hypothetical protein